MSHGMEAGCLKFGTPTCELMPSVDPQIVDFVRSAAPSEDFATYLRRILTELVEVNTAPQADLAASGAREQALFDRVEREIGEWTGGRAVCERPRIDPAIHDDPAYSLPGYAADGRGHVPPPERVYAGRTNFLVTVPGASGEPAPAAILHAHADVVSPWFGPRVDGSRVYGGGQRITRLRSPRCSGSFGCCASWLSAPDGGRNAAS